MDTKIITDPELLEVVVKLRALRTWCGPDSHIVTYTLREGRQFNLVLVVPDDLPPEISRQHADVDQMRMIFEGWDPLLCKFLDLVQSVDKWKLMHRMISLILRIAKYPIDAETDPSLETWHHPAGKFVMIGDGTLTFSAFTGRLQFGNSLGCSCTPDAALLGPRRELGRRRRRGESYLAHHSPPCHQLHSKVLGECLARIENQKDIAKAIVIYEKIRKPRSDKVVAGTLTQKACFHACDGPIQQERDEKLGAQMRTGIHNGPALHMNDDFWGFICSYDPYEEVKQNWDRLYAE